MSDWMVKVNLNGVEVSVPSCGKFEVEWALAKLLNNSRYHLNPHDLRDEMVRHFQGAGTDEAWKWVVAARQKMTLMKQKKECEMRKMWYGYEYAMTGTWQPVVWYDDHPDRKYPMSNGKDNRPARSNVIEVTGDNRDGDEPLWGRLKAANPPPAPKVVKDEATKVIIPSAEV